MCAGSIKINGNQSKPSRVNFANVHFGPSWDRRWKLAQQQTRLKEMKVTKLFYKCVTKQFRFGRSCCIFMSACCKDHSVFLFTLSTCPFLVGFKPLALGSGFCIIIDFLVS